MSTSPSVLLIAGSPSGQSRSAALLDSVAERLLLQKNLTVDRLNIRELPASALLLADWDHPSIVAAIAQVARARAVVVATPVYKAAYSGVLKVFLDLLPQTALKDKTVLPLATGGSPHHMLALDYALRFETSPPVLQTIKVSKVDAVESTASSASLPSLLDAKACAHLRTELAQAPHNATIRLDFSRIEIVDETGRVREIRRPR